MEATKLATPLPADAPTAETRLQLGAMLVRDGLLTAEQLEEALAEKEASGRRLGEILVERKFVAEIGRGLCVLVGVAEADGEADAARLAGRVARLRIFENEDGKFDRSVRDAGGEALVVSQFTLIADTAKGNRPSFSGAARPELAEPLVEGFCASLREEGIRVATGRFGSRMLVALENDGPVTIVLDR